MRRGPAEHGDIVNPDLPPDPDTQRWWARYLRVGASPSMARDLMLMNAQIDVRMLLSEIHSPTLVLHRGDDRWVEVGNGRYLASHIVGAKFVELSGTDHRPWVEDADAVLDQVQAAICGTLRRPRHANSSLGVLALSRREHEIVLLAVAGHQRRTSPATCSSANAPSKHTCATPIRNSTSAPSSNSPDEHPNSAFKPIRRETSSGSGRRSWGSRWWGRSSEGGVEAATALGSSASNALTVKSPDRAVRKSVRERASGLGSGGGI